MPQMMTAFTCHFVITPGSPILILLHLCSSTSKCMLFRRAFVNHTCFLQCWVIEHLPMSRQNLWIRMLSELCSFTKTTRHRPWNLVPWKWHTTISTALPLGQQPAKMPPSALCTRASGRSQRCCTSSNRKLCMF